MPFISDFGLNWYTDQLAGQPITIGLHTDSPGNSGTAHELSSAGARNYARTTVAASGWTSSGAQTDNDANVNVFTPNAASAGDTVTHVSYWLGADFFGWAELQSTVPTIEGVPFIIAAGTADFTVMRSS